MKLAFSAMGWTPGLDDDAAAILKAAGFAAVELLPTRIWPDLASVAPQDADAERIRWARRGCPIVALQALLFGRSDLVLFGDGAQLDEFSRFMGNVLQLGARLGARVLVFGAPRNRIRGSIPWSDAFERAAEVFRRLGDMADRLGTCLCIEPNPGLYGADFVTNASEGLALVRAVDSGGFGLHLDTACMTLADDNLGNAIKSAIDELRHFHVSEPHLGPVGVENSTIRHRDAADALIESRYRGYVSVEMLATTDDPLANLAVAAEFTARVYGVEDY